MNAINAVQLFIVVWTFTTVCQADDGKRINFTIESVCENDEGQNLR